MEPQELNNGICNECAKRGICETLCPEAELFASQEDVDWGETPVLYTDPKRGELRVYDPVKNTDEAFLTAQEKVILDALNKRISRPNIAVLLGISRSCLRTHIQNLRRKASRFDQE